MSASKQGCCEGFIRRTISLSQAGWHTATQLLRDDFPSWTQDSLQKHPFHSQFWLPPKLPEHQRMLLPRAPACSLGDRLEGKPLQMSAAAISSSSAAPIPALFSGRTDMRTSSSSHSSQHSIPILAALLSAEDLSMGSAASPLLQAMIFMEVARLQMNFWLHGTRICPGSSMLFAGRCSTCSVAPKCDPDGFFSFNSCC